MLKPRKGGEIRYGAGEGVVLEVQGSKMGEVVKGGGDVAGEGVEG